MVVMITVGDLIYPMDNTNTTENKKDDMLVIMCSHDLLVSTGGKKANRFFFLNILLHY